jgi:hypothetical protein
VFMIACECLIIRLTDIMYESMLKEQFSNLTSFNFVCITKQNYSDVLNKLDLYIIRLTLRYVKEATYLKRVF